jgi:hypothetical protein
MKGCDLLASMYETLGKCKKKQIDTNFSIAVAKKKWELLKKQL